MKNHTEGIKDISVALCKAQAEINKAHKTSNNPFYKSKYADLSSVWEACREALKNNELSVAQFGECDTDGQYLVTMLMHSSGQYIKGFMRLEFKEKDMQKLGSAITYARRYGLTSMIGICTEDDDANASMPSSKPPTQTTTTPPPSKSYECSGCGVVIPEVVYKYSTERLGSALCRNCQKTQKQEGEK